MKTIIPTPTPTTFFLPADDLRAAFHCISTEQTRYYLCGVLIGADKLVALDGRQMLTIELPDGCHVGKECFTQENGFILSCDATDKAFKHNGKVPLWVYGDTATGILQFVLNHGKGLEMTRVGVLEFGVIDGTYPDWQRIVARGDGGAAILCYDPAVLARLVKAADVIKKGRAVRLTGGEGVGDPIKVEFRASARLRGTLMPMRWTGA